MSSTQPTRPETIALIHGLWMTPLSWEPLDRAVQRAPGVAPVV
jgi:hypothetical protein